MSNSEHRVKTQAELDQEAADAAFARQLQDEADAQQAQQQAHRAQQQQQAAHQQPPQFSGGGGGGGAAMAPRGAPAESPTMIHTAAALGLPQLNLPHVRCTKCHAINTIQPAKSHLQQICGQCQKLLPPLGEQGTAPPVARAGGTSASPAGASSASSSSPLVPAPDAPAPAPAPAGGAAPAGGGAPPPTSPATAPGGDGVLQGTVQTQMLQARCGQCQSINALPVQDRTPGASLSFKCGQCEAINKITL